MQSCVKIKSSKNKTKHVNLDEKNPDTVFYDEKYMPNIEEKAETTNAVLSSIKQDPDKKLKTKRVTKKLVEISLHKGSDRDKPQSKLSREDLKIQRQLFLMNSGNKSRMSNNSKKRGSVKAAKKSLMVNDKFDLMGKATLKEFLFDYFSKDNLENGEEKTVLLLSEKEEMVSDLENSDYEDIKVCSSDYFIDHSNNLVAKPKKPLQKQSARRRKKKSKGSTQQKSNHSVTIKNMETILEENKSQTKSSELTSLNKNDLSLKRTNLKSKRSEFLSKKFNQNSSQEIILIETDNELEKELLLNKRDYNTGIQKTNNKILESKNCAIISLNKNHEEETKNKDECKSMSLNVKKIKMCEGIVCLDLTRQFQHLSFVTEEIN